jgi:hypothetical protein
VFYVGHINEKCTTKLIMVQITTREFKEKKGEKREFRGL